MKEPIDQKGLPITRRKAMACLAVAASVRMAVAGAEQPVVQVRLNQEDPSLSQGTLRLSDGSTLSFPVGYGRHGYLAEGARFQGGYSLLGDFRINAILSNDRFEMEPALIESSGKSADWLKENLFRNMSSIDFDGDGQGGEYGHAFISLEPLNDTPQPFGFHPYRGVFRWYSYALHGTQDPDRIGKCVTGGCVNLGREDLETVLRTVKLGDLVEVGSGAKSGH